MPPFWAKYRKWGIENENSPFRGKILKMGCFGRNSLFRAKILKIGCLRWKFPHFEKNPEFKLFRLNLFNKLKMWCYVRKYAPFGRNSQKRELNLKLPQSGQNSDNWMFRCKTSTFSVNILKIGGLFQKYPIYGENPENGLSRSKLPTPPPLGWKSRKWGVLFYNVPFRAETPKMSCLCRKCLI